METTVGNAGWKDVARSIRRTARRTRNRLRRTSVILLYHRVAEGFADPWSLCVSPSNFRAHMAVLAARGVTPLDELVDDLAPGRRRRQVAVTFDDGYADFRTTALSILREHGVPTTLFVATGGLEGDQEFWWDELERIMLGSAALPDTLEVPIETSVFSWAFATDGDRRTLYFSLHQRLGRLPGASRARVLGDLRRWAGVTATSRATHRPLSASDLALIARDDSVRVGAHTVSHSYLASLEREEQAREIRESKRMLEGLTGRRVEHFSYPHGDHDRATIELVRESGFRIACGSECGPVVADADPFDLPRTEVPNFGGSAFARWLDEWVG